MVTVQSAANVASVIISVLLQGTVREETQFNTL